MGTIKDRNGMDLKEAEDIEKRWQEYWSNLLFPPPVNHVLSDHVSSREYHMQGGPQ